MTMITDPIYVKVLDSFANKKPSMATSAVLREMIGLDLITDAPYKITKFGQVVLDFANKYGVMK